MVFKAEKKGKEPSRLGHPIVLAGLLLHHVFGSTFWCGNSCLKSQDECRESCKVVAGDLQKLPLKRARGEPLTHNKTTTHKFHLHTHTPEVRTDTLTHAKKHTDTLFPQTHRVSRHPHIFTDTHAHMHLTRKVYRHTHKFYMDTQMQRDHRVPGEPQCKLG